MIPVAMHVTVVSGIGDDTVFLAVIKVSKCTPGWFSARIIALSLQGSGFRVPWFRVQGSVHALFRVRGSGFRVQGSVHTLSWFRVQGSVHALSWFRVQGSVHALSWFRVQGSVHTLPRTSTHQPPPPPPP